MTDFQQQVQFQMPSPTKLLTPAVTTILVFLVVGFTLIVYARDFTFLYLGLSKSGIFSGRVWQLITYSLINGGCGLVFNGLIILFFGSLIERQWKTRYLLMLLLTVGIVCGLVWILISILLGKDLVGIGSASLAYGLIGAFGLLFRKQRFWCFLWTLEAQTIAWIMIVIGLVGGIAWPMLWVWVSGALIAYLYIKLWWKIQNHRQSYASSPSTQMNGFVDID